MPKIISGLFRGRILKAPPGNQTRPTLERVRQAWMNALQFDLEGSQILDLFSGSGALGFEALSRGAEFVVFVEKDPKIIPIIQDNARTLGVESRCRFVRDDVMKALQKSSEQFDFIFADPPYQGGFELQLSQGDLISKALKPNGVLCLESAYRKEGPFVFSDDLQVIRNVRYGETQLVFYRKNSNLSE